MVVNDNYHSYFDRCGNLINDPLGQQREERVREKEERKRAAEEARANRNNTPKATDTQTPTNKTANTETTSIKTTNTKTTDMTTKPTNLEERTVDEIKATLLQKEELLNRTIEELNQKHKEADEKLQQLQEAQEELDELIEVRKYKDTERQRAYLKLLDGILDKYIHIVNEQAKRRPDTFMRMAQIRSINEVLSRLRNIFIETDAADYLHLAEEPREDDLEHYPGTTYGEMAILLSAYTNTLFALTLDRLYLKNTPFTPKEEKTDEKDEADDE